jgi:hypothetical protein
VREVAESIMSDDLDRDIGPFDTVDKEKGDLVDV